jgi:hypothetical protein
MTTSQYVLNLGLLALILAANLGTRVMSVRRLALPVIVVVLAAIVYLRGLPTTGNSTYLELAGAVAGVLLGVAAAMLVRVRRQADRVLATAGGAFAGLWIAVIGGRILFAYAASHWLSRTIGTFSLRHELAPGAWTAGFVLMALTMIVARVAVAGAQWTRALHDSPRPVTA